MQLIINTDLEKALPAVIDWNHEQLKGELTERLTHYKNLVVTEDDIQGAKEDRAKLNKLRTAFDDKRKEVKKACLKPYEDFERKAKEVLALVDQPIAAVDSQLKSFEDVKKAEKRMAIEQIYTDNIGNLAELLPFYRLWSDKWLNVGEKLPAIEKAIIDAVTRFRNDLGIIKAMRLDFEQQVLDVYIRTLDMSAALEEKTRLEEQAKQLEQLEASRPAESTERPEPEAVDIPAPAPVKSLDTGMAAPEEPKTIRVVFYDTTAAFRAEMKALTKKHNIEYGSVK